jgi:hypothetical protein
MNRIKKNSILNAIIVFYIGAFMICSNIPALADDVTDAVEDGLKKYNEGNYGAAAGQFEYAAQLARQKKGGQLKDFLNTIKPIDAWTGEEATSQAVGAGIMGGGITVERTFKKDSSSMMVSIITDSPLLQSMMMMFSNPMIATAGGGELATIAGQRAIVKYDPSKNKGEIQIVVDGRYMFGIEAKNTSKEEMVKQVESVDFKALAAIP